MRSLVPWLAVLGAGCPDRTLSEVDPRQFAAVTKTIPVRADIDLVFVIDNSGSTQDKQLELHVERTVSAAPDSVLRVSCAVEPR